MNSKTMIAAFVLASLSFFGSGAAAQHPQHHPASGVSQEQAGSPMMGQGMMGQKMTATSKDMQKLMGRLMENMAAMEKQGDLAGLKKLMAEQHSLLTQMDQTMRHCSGMMQNTMDRMKNCAMTGAQSKQGSK